jgi:hypothetical protein
MSKREDNKMSFSFPNGNSEAHDERADLPEAWVETPLAALVDDIQTGFACGTHNQEGQGIAHIHT